MAVEIRGNRSELLRVLDIANDETARLQERLEDILDNQLPLLRSVLAAMQDEED